MAPGAGMSMSATMPSRFISTGDVKACEVRSTGVLAGTKPETHFVGSMPRQGRAHQLVAVPGYGGHVAGKVAENFHGGTFRQENVRAHGATLGASKQNWSSISAPQFSRTDSWGRGTEHAPRIPGYSGMVPGKHTEMVAGVRFAEASEVSRQFREQRDPAVSTTTWLRRGNWPVDRMNTYKFHNRVQSHEAQSMFTNEEEAHASEANRQMGHIFGLKPPKGNPYRPGDRYMHTKCKRKDKKDPRMLPENMQPAGQPSQSHLLDTERWKLHNALMCGSSPGNMRLFR